MLENSYLHEFCAQVKNTIFDFFAQNSWRYESSDIFANTVVKSCKKVKSSKKTICDTCAQKSWSFVFCYIFAPYYNCMSEKVTKLIST